MLRFDQAYEEWMQSHIAAETNHRRRGLLEKGLCHSSVTFLRSTWFPAVRNFTHLHPELEERDLNNGYRYLDFAYLPRGNVKGGIEVHDFGSHARDLDPKRFKDLCWRQSLLSLDDWVVITVAYLSIIDEPKRCQQLVLSFVGKFVAMDVPEQLNWLEAETVRYARRLLRPFTPADLALHLRISPQHARRILHVLVELHILLAVGGKERYRSYMLRP